ncbi:hypothetical protein LPJ63_004841 [Coemansia sp. RSA 2711]|nr:hypothetical protein LPJ63_004841 [Coemansia sp. RSA 2711]
MQPVVVVGAGVIGLSVANRLQESGEFHVIVVAENVPGGKSQSAKWASPWAGAHWRAWATNTDRELQAMETQTYRAMLAIAAKTPEAGIHVAPGLDLFETAPEEPPWYASIVDDACELSAEQLPAGVAYGLQYTTLLIDVPIYLEYLSRRFTLSGGAIVNRYIGHILDAVQYAPKQPPARATAPIIVNCTGLGSRSLGGVRDNAVYPSRGQTIVVNAPNAKRSITQLGSRFGYVIPRGNGTVVLGGTADKHQWDCEPDPQVTQTIIRRCLELEPGLLPANARTLDTNAKARMLGENIVSVNVGLRPMRDGGVRLESQTMCSGCDKVFTVVHCYGHGGFGYQSSLAYADKVFTLVTEAAGTVLNS